MSKIQITKVGLKNIQTKEQGYVTRIVNRENLTLEELAAEAAIGSTFQQGEIYGVMKLVFDAAARKFADGKGISLGALGKLMPGLKSHWSAKPEQQTKASLTLYAKYEPTRDIQKAIDEADLVWVTRSTDSKAEEQDSADGNNEEENDESPESTLYTITYMHDGSQYTTQQYAEGATVNAPQAPEGYSWVGCPTTMPGRDLTVTSFAE